MTAFAEIGDVEALCVSGLTSAQDDRAGILLERAANRIRSYTGQTFDKLQTTDTLRATGAVVRLPQRPVISVDAVEVVDYLGRTYTVPAFGFDQIDRIDLATYGAVLNLPEAITLDGLWSGTVKVTYTHGYEPVPEEIVDLNAELVARIFNSPLQGQVGIRSQAVGPYLMSFDPGGGAVVLSQEDKAVLDRYRTFGATVELP